MKVLWLCNMVLNEFAGEFKLRHKPFGGWMESLLHSMGKMDIKYGFCFPIIDNWRMKNSSLHGMSYYSFCAENDWVEYRIDMKEEFEAILLNFQPDVIHIWGTEYNHARAMIDAASNLGILNRVLVRIQGLVSLFPNVYFKGIPEKYLDLKGDISKKSIRDEKNDFFLRGENEKFILKKVLYAYGRGDWDRFYVSSLNPSVRYASFDNILRESFYKNKDRWSVDKCFRHSIFVCQAHYPLKGFHFLLMAVNLLQIKYSDLKVYVGGLNLLKMGTGYTKFIHDIILLYKLENKIVFLGPLSEEDVIKLNLKANVTVCPSVLDNRANSMLEAMMIGTPTIASYVGGNVGAISHGKDGFMYPVEDVFSLAGYIDEIFSDDILATRISQQAIMTALARHNKEKIIKKTYELYKKVAFF